MRKDGWVFFVHEVEGGRSVRLEGSEYDKERSSNRFVRRISSV